MIRVVIKQSVAGLADPRYGLGDFSFHAGQIVDIDDDLAAAWFASDTAVSKEEIEAALPPPPVPEPPPEEIPEAVPEPVPETVPEAPEEVPEPVTHKKARR
jgi:hypothetical protein